MNMETEEFSVTRALKDKAASAVTLAVFEKQGVDATRKLCME